MCQKLWYELNPRVRCAFGNVFALLRVPSVTHVGTPSAALKQLFLAPWTTRRCPDGAKDLSWNLKHVRCSMRAMVSLTTSLSKASICWKVKGITPSLHRNQGLSKWPPPSTKPRRNRKRKIMFWSVLSFVRLNASQTLRSAFSQMLNYHWVQTVDNKGMDGKMERASCVLYWFVLRRRRRFPTTKKAPIVWISPEDCLQLEISTSWLQILTFFLPQMSLCFAGQARGAHALKQRCQAVKSEATTTQKAALQMSLENIHNL